MVFLCSGISLVILTRDRQVSQNVSVESSSLFHYKSYP